MIGSKITYRQKNVCSSKHQDTKGQSAFRVLMTSWAGPQTLDSQPAGVVEQVIGDQRVRESHTLAVSHTSHTSHTGMCESGAIEVIKSKNSWVSHTSRKVLWNV